MRAIVCTRGSRSKSKPCACGIPSTKLCDYPLKGSKLGSTCDRPMCDAHAVPQGKNVDYCQPYATLAAKGTP